MKAQLLGGLKFLLLVNFFVVNIFASEEIKILPSNDAGVSSVIYKGDDEKIKSWGKYPQFKLKSIQEMGLLNFDLSQYKGKEIIKAKLYLRNVSQENRVRYLRISSITSPWKEGQQKQKYGDPDGACYQYSNWQNKTEWAWPGSQICDVIMGAGFSRSNHVERKIEENQWMSFEIPTELIYAMVLGNSFGLAIQDGGDLSYTNNWIYSKESKGNEPYLLLELGGELKAKPSKPVVQVSSGDEVAKENMGAIKVVIDEPQNTFHWQIKVNGKDVALWQIPAPKKKRAEFYIEYLEGNKDYQIEIIGVSKGGVLSDKVTLTAKSSKLLTIPFHFGEFKKPSGEVSPLSSGKSFKVWACPNLVKISPETGNAMFKEMIGENGSQISSIWDGKKVSLFGCRGEYVSFQVIIEKQVDKLDDIQVSIEGLKNKNGESIQESKLELYKNWYSKNKNQQWQPAYCVPLKHHEKFSLPDPKRNLETQNNQSIYVDIYLPKEAVKGIFKGNLVVKAKEEKVVLPIEIEVFNFLMPDKLSFWPQLNTYGIGLDRRLITPSYQLAHQHRNVYFFRNYIPKLSGKGANIKVDWQQYDQQVGPILSGEAFANNRRKNMPIEALALPFKDSWPTNLTKETYLYKGTWVLESERDKNKLKKLTGFLNEHYYESPKIEEGLTQEYKDAFISVQKQFIEHFAEKGWNQTENQCLFMGKNTHRIQYLVNMWWTTDEPYHLIDWLAICFFGKMWVDHRGEKNAKNWVFRSDISRPQWQGNLLDGIVDNIHFGTGALVNPSACRRVEMLVRNGGFDKRVYGAANKDNSSNYDSIVWFLTSWLNGANAALPWESIGPEKCLDINDRPGGGSALIVPGEKRFGVPVVGDIRLKAFRDGQQLLEYLTLFANKYQLSREQVNIILRNSIKLVSGVRAGAGADNADALEFHNIQAWEINQLRYVLAKAIEEKDEK